ncbi:MAG: 3-deoxy-8-phosphooctulonate synthase [Deltaproteobacteria bacterium]|nr:3-deoxy-8-phosphooctulonate synthase [Deltaproteobacteria bacterium]MBW2382951.1 3-deoxy-8-phosphooctulonate synthase [Deltaproteobacteria bacterium]
MQIGDIPIGEGAPLVLIAGLNVLEDEMGARECAEELVALAQRHALPLVFKASFDKANRTRADGFRGPGIDAGLRILAGVREACGIPVLTDVHEPEQAKRAAEVVDCLQVPAMLCRQTDLLAACAATGQPVNLKKGQFIAPRDFRHAVEKIRHFGGREVMVTERGSSFGHGDLVVDMRGLVQLREIAPVCMDATHAVQRPGQRDGASGGDRRFVAPLARAAVAVGVDALFVEMHPEPDRARVDGPCQIDAAALDILLGEVRAIEKALRAD